MSTLPMGRAMEPMDWLGLAAVGLNLLMLTLSQGGKKGWAADRPIPLAANCLGGLLGTISAIGALYWPLVVLMGLWLVSSAYNLARVLMAKRDIRMAAAVAKQGA